MGAIPAGCISGKDLLKYSSFKKGKIHDEFASLFSRANNKEWELTISSLTFANTNYILKKLKSAKEAGKIFKKFKVLVELLCLDNGTCFE